MPQETIILHSSNKLNEASLYTAEILSSPKVITFPQSLNSSRKPRI